MSKKETLSPSPDSAVAVSPTGVLEGQLERLISEVSHLNIYLIQSVSRFGEHVQDLGFRLTNVENRLKSVEGQNSRPESETQESKADMSDLGSGSDEQFEVPLFSSSERTASPGHALGSKLDQVISEVNQLNAFMSHTVDGFRDQFQFIEKSLQDQNNKLEGLDARLDVVKRITKVEGEGGELSRICNSVSCLGVEDLLKKLGASLVKSITVDNCVFIFQLASHWKLDDLKAASHDIICKNFSQVSETCMDYCNLSLEELRLLVFSDSVYATEEQVFEAIMRWIGADLPKRQSLIFKLLLAIRISRCPLRFLKNALNHYLVQNQHNFQTCVQERIQGLTTGALSDDPCGTEDLPRAGGRDLLFVMGGYDKVDTVETLDPAVGSWVSHKIQDPPSGWTWTCSVGKKIMVLEWKNKRFRSFDITTRKWSLLQYLPQHREGLTVAGSGDCIYVLGGQAPHGKRCDRYNGCTDQWEEMAPLGEGREYAACVCYAGNVYYLGGWSVPGGCHLASFEVLDPRDKGQWSPLPPMGIGRYHHCLVSCSRFLWAIGGYKGNTYLSDVERYNVKEQLWSRIRELPTPRAHISACLLGGKMHVIGGQTGGKYISSVEVYIEEKDCWDSVALLPEPRRSLGSCVIHSLSFADVQQYAVSIK